jgi:hypothetical protein
MGSRNLSERRRPRAKLKVIHRHRSDGREAAPRESELVFTHGGAVAILEWIDMGGIRTPVFVLPLDRKKLHRESERTYSYEDVTLDPRDAGL